MLTLFDNLTALRSTQEDIKHFSKVLNVANRSKMSSYELHAKIQELTLADENVSNVVEEYLHKKAAEKLENMEARKVAREQSRAVQLEAQDLSQFIGKYFQAQASYMVRIYQVVGHTSKRLKIGPVKTIFTGTTQFPQYTLDRSYKSYPAHLVKLTEYEGHYSFTHDHFSYFDVGDQTVFSCCEY